MTRDLLLPSSRVLEAQHRSTRTECLTRSHLVSASRISASQDKALDRSVSARKSDAAGLIIPDDMDVDSMSNKRKSRTSITKISYKDESDSEGEPLVSICKTACASRDAI